MTSSSQVMLTTTNCCYYFFFKNDILGSSNFTQIFFSFTTFIVRPSGENSQ